MSRHEYTQSTEATNISAWDRFTQRTKEMKSGISLALTLAIGSTGLAACSANAESQPVQPEETQTETVVEPEETHESEATPGDYPEGYETLVEVSEEFELDVTDINVRAEAAERMGLFSPNLENYQGIDPTLEGQALVEAFEIPIADNLEDVDMVKDIAEPLAEKLSAVTMLANTFETFRYTNEGDDDSDYQERFNEVLDAFKEALYDADGVEPSILTKMIKDESDKNSRYFRKYQPTITFPIDEPYESRGIEFPPIQLTNDFYFSEYKFVSVPQYLRHNDGTLGLGVVLSHETNLLDVANPNLEEEGGSTDVAINGTDNQYYTFVVGSIDGKLKVLHFEKNGRDEAPEITSTQNNTQDKDGKPRTDESFYTPFVDLDEYKAIYQTD